MLGKKTALPWSSEADGDAPLCIWPLLNWCFEEVQLSELCVVFSLVVSMFVDGLEAVDAKGGSPRRPCYGRVVIGRGTGLDNIVVLAMRFMYILGGSGTPSALSERAGVVEVSTSVAKSVE